MHGILEWELALEFCHIYTHYNTLNIVIVGLKYRQTTTIGTSVLMRHTCTKVKFDIFQFACPYSCTSSVRYKQQAFFSP